MNGTQGDASAVEALRELDDFASTKLSMHEASTFMSNKVLEPMFGSNMHRFATSIVDTKTDSIMTV